MNKILAAVVFFPCAFSGFIWPDLGWAAMPIGAIGGCVAAGLFFAD